jgi:hypothetical protein
MEISNSTTVVSDSIASALERCDLNSACRSLAERLERCNQHAEVGLACPDLVDELAHLTKPLNERCLPLLKQYSSECLVASGLNLIGHSWEQRVVPTSLVAFLSVGHGLYVIAGCRPSNAQVELVVQTGANIWIHRGSQCQPCKFPENRYAEGLLGFNYGFLCVFRVPDHQGIRQIWVNGFAVNFAVQNLEDAPYLDQIDDLLHLCRLVHLPISQLPELLDDGLFALACRLRDPLRNNTDWPSWIAQDESNGCPPSAPKATLVIPLYGVWKIFMQGHLAAFALDPCFFSGDVEVLYVVDDPMIEVEVVRWLRNSGSYLPFPIRVVCLRRNMGFGMACNIGVQSARADVVVLMNSDVFPNSQGWLNQLLARLRTYPDALVAPLLTYETGLLQHFGMHVGFDGSKTSAIPRNFHSLKGLHPTQLHLGEAAGGIQEPEAISGAVLAFHRDDFLNAGGFDPIFGRGDFEDLELSMRWKRLCGPLLQDASARLLHLERQSMHLVEADLGVWRGRFNALCAMRLCSELSEGKVV